MKRLLYIMIISLMMLVLVACGDKQETNNKNTEAVTETQETEQEEEKIETYWVKGTTVNLRKAPNMDAEVICRLTKGTEVLKTGVEGEWLCITYGEEQGYIHKDYASYYLPVNTVEGEIYIVVKKSERLLELWQGETLIISVPIGLGRVPEGHKQVEGDGKTPEGEYYVCVRNSNSKFYLSLGVSYPDKEDAAAALADGRIDKEIYDCIVEAIDNWKQPDWYTPLGGAIMIHGHGSASDWTEGCIAVENEVMDILFEYCALRTKITILP